MWFILLNMLASIAGSIIGSLSVLALVLLIINISKGSRRR
jgi:uncharacterized membrane protein